jgi:hypothetical protein
LVEIFVIGFPKSGTTTLHNAFRQAGIRSAHWVVPEGYCGQLIYRDFRAGRNPLAQLARYDAVTQADVCMPDRTHDGEQLNFWPQLDFEVIDAIESHNPDIKFVLNRRSVADLVKSIDQWGWLRERLAVSEIIGLPEGKGRTDDELRAWIEGHYAACSERFAGNPNFLDFDIADADAKQRLERFSGVELPWWGVVNKNPRSSDPAY